MVCHASAFVLVTAVLAAPTPLLAPLSPPLPWNNSGHRTVSFLAWHELSETTRGEVTKLLQQHPRFHDDLQLGVDASTDAATAARLAFALASNWPDTVRSASHPMHRIANHPTWHYIDMPFVVGDLQVTPATVAPDNGASNVVEAITKNLADLANRELPASDRAIALCWVVHLIEDVHQPLHATTLYSSRFPTGDKGGNSFQVVRGAFDGNNPTNLHSVWDSLLGNYQSPSWEACVADGLAEKHDLSREHFAALLAVHDPAVWARESHELGVEYGYLRGELAGVTAAEGDTKKPQPLPNGYLAAAEGIAMQRAAIAAHRLADALNSIFDAK